MSTTLSLVITY